MSRTRALKASNRTDGIGRFNIAHNRRFSAKETGPNFFQIIEEHRENGQWVQKRWVTEEGGFVGIVAVSERAAALAKDARDELYQERVRAGQWRTMRYPADFANTVPRNFLPGRLPPEWDIMIDDRPIDMGNGIERKTMSFFLREDGMRVNVNMQQLNDGKFWLAVAVAFPDHIPDWEDMCAAKDLFIGKERFALQVHPSAKEYVNVSVNMLHIFCPLNGWTLPNFRPFVG